MLNTVDPTNPQAVLLRSSVKRVPELDGVRGLAAICVVLYHAFPFSPFFWGWAAVDLFFVLSGFLITTIILSQSDSTGFLRSFYLRRVYRIWPVYYLTLAGVLVANHFSTTGYPTTGLTSHLFFLQNTPEYAGMVPPPFVHTFAPSWSVAIEEQYYLFWPLLLLLIGGRRVPFLVAMLLALCFAGRLIFGAGNLLFTRGDGLAFGCGLAWLIKNRTNLIKDVLVQRILGIAGVVGSIYVGVYLVRFWGDPYPKWGTTCFTGFSLLFFALVGSCVLYSGSLFLAPFRNKLLRWFGTISYALYLFHLPLLTYSGTLIGRAGVHSPPLQVFGTWLLIIGLPALSWYCFEAPILRWKESLIRSRSETKTIVEVAMPQILQLPIDKR